MKFFMTNPSLNLNPFVTNGYTLFFNSPLQIGGTKKEPRKQNTINEDALDGAIRKIADLRLGKPKQHPNIEKICDSILKRYSIIHKKNETICPEVRDAIIAFSHQTNEENTLPKLLEWMNQSPDPLPPSVDPSSFPISLDEQVEHTLTFFESREIQDPQQVAQCVRSFPYFYEEKTQHFATVLSSYLERTDGVVEMKR